MTAFSFSNITILKAIAGRKKVHIVDYGVNYGVQWPTLLYRLATLEGGPPEVRITVIDLPQPGFRPAVQIEETGRRLSNYARQLSVPFKFHGITVRWDTVCVDDLNIDPDEVLIVNSIMQFGNLTDEGVDIDSPSPRDVVLRTIRKMQPDAFILYVMNASYSAPFCWNRGSMNDHSNTNNRQGIYRRRTSRRRTPISRLLLLNYNTTRLNSHNAYA